MASQQANSVLMMASQVGQAQVQLDKQRDRMVEAIRDESARNMRTPHGNLYPVSYGRGYQYMDPNMTQFDDPAARTRSGKHPHGLPAGQSAAGPQAGHPFYGNQYTGPMPHPQPQTLPTLFNGQPLTGVPVVDPSIQNAPPIGMTSPGGTYYGYRSPGGNWWSGSPEQPNRRKFVWPTNAAAAWEGPRSPGGTTYNYPSPGGGYWSGQPRTQGSRRYVGPSTQQTMVPQVNVQQPQYRQY